jgi:hypothetical protein
VDQGSRYCSQHPIITVSKAIPWEDAKGNSRSTMARLEVPNPVGGKSSLHGTSKSKGLGGDRACGRALAVATDAAAQGDEGVAWALALQQREEVNEGNLDLVNFYLRSKINLEQSPTDRPASLPLRILDTAYTPERKLRSKTTVRLSELTDGQVKQETGFPSVVSLLTYVAVLTNGDMGIMTSAPTSILTWFEFWYIFFVIAWSKSFGRWRDLERRYSVSDPVLRDVFDRGLWYSLSAKKSWPTFATFAEDKALQDSERWAAYENRRPVFWDTSNLPIATPSNAEDQSLTWNSYYHMNCAKIAIGVQPCGFIVVPQPWVGAGSDTLMHSKHDGILPEQQQFQKEDIVRCEDGSDKEIPFLNGLDRGYRVTEACFNAGRQLVEQPHFAPGDGKFSTHSALFSSAFASDRSGNERAVKMVKHSNYLTNGLQSTGDIDRFCDAVEAWGFQINFMFLPVH